MGKIKKVRKPKNQIDLKKEYRTLNKQAVRLYAKDGDGEYPVHGAVFSLEHQVWVVCEWTIYGRAYPSDTKNYLNLVEIPPKIEHEYWANVYSTGIKLFHTKLEADKNASANRLGCVKIKVECEIGEGIKHGK